MPCGQSSIEAFYKGLPRKKVKLNMITSTVANFPPQKNLVLLQQALSLILSWFLPVLKFQMKILKNKFLLMN